MDSFSKFTISIDGDWSFARLNKTVLNTRLVIVLTKAWSTVDNTSTSIGSDEVSADDSEALLLFKMLEVFKQGNITLSDEVLSWNLLENLVLLDVCLLQDLLQA